MPRLHLRSSAQLAFQALGVALLMALQLVVMSPATADAPGQVIAAEARLLALINAERAAVGSGSVQLSAGLSETALGHANEMSRTATLRHSDTLVQDVTNVVAHWGRAAENVGRAQQLDELHGAFMTSTAHAANVRNASWSHVGIGVVNDGHRYWATVRFLNMRAGRQGPSPTTIRLDGATRTDTAALVTEAVHAPASTDTVMIVAADGHVPALAVSALAGALHAPILLSNPTGDGRDAIRAAERVLGAGSEGSIVLVGDVGTGVRRWAASQSRRVEHHSAADPADLAGDLARRLPQRPERVILARSDVFADALAGAALAAHTGWPVLFTDADELSGPTRRVITQLRPSVVHVLGGAAAIDDRVLDQVRRLDVDTVTRLAGADRAGTAVAIAEEGIRQGMQVRRPVIATGWSFPDALAGSVLATDVVNGATEADGDLRSGAIGGPILLTHPDRVPPATAAFLARHADEIDWAVLLGGGQAISRDVEADVRGLLSGS